MAIEKVIGALNDRKGSFALVHRAVMRPGQPQDWTVSVVPGSGAEALEGIDGAIQIKIIDGRHFYEFTYTLPDA